MSRELGFSSDRSLKVTASSDRTRNSNKAHLEPMEIQEVVIIITVKIIQSL